jgi:hypothetical protein
MSDFQFWVLIATIVLCTLYMANVVYLAGKAIREQMARQRDQ